MKYDYGLKILCSIPVILFVLYISPVLGIILLILRFLFYDENIKTYIITITFSFILTIPKLLKTFKINTSKIPYLNNIINSKLYNKSIINYSKRLFIISIIMLVISALSRKLIDKMISSIKEHFRKREEQKYQIEKENNLIIKERREAANNMHSIKCPYCGSDILTSEKVCVCKYCRRQIEYINEDQ